MHVPFCAARCAYCDFHSVPSCGVGSAAMERMVDATLKNAAYLVRRFCPDGPEFDTVYVGGGTPTILRPSLLGRLLDGIASICGSPPLEWTVEANPESLDEATLETLLRRPVTRLSIGVQSLDAETLILLGRPGGVPDNERAIRLASASGLALSADLMTALPRRPGCMEPDSGVLAAEASFLADSGFRHLSVYDLVPEEGTAMTAMLDRGELRAADEDAAYEARTRMEEALAGKGMRRYEISNYAVRGSESLHNGAYWAMRSYLGSGSGAVSTLRVSDSQAFPGQALPGLAGAGLRIEQSRDFAAYIADPARSAVETPISSRDSAFETIMMAFRTSRGLDCADFYRRFGIEARDLIGESLLKWSDFLVRDRSDGSETGVADGNSGTFLALGGRGMDIANRFLVDCLEELEKRFPGGAGPAGSVKETHVGQIP
ncbi:MAG: radical SAM protein [Rectinemataceae bacterium]